MTMEVGGMRDEQIELIDAGFHNALDLATSNFCNKRLAATFCSC